VLNCVAISTEDDALRSFFLDRLHARTTGDEISNVGLFIAVVVMEMQGAVVVKATLGAG